MSIKIYAPPECSGIFRRSVEARTETWNRLGYAMECFGCGKWDGTHGYSVDSGFLCGFGVLPLPELSVNDVDVVKDAMKRQDAYFNNMNKVV